MPFNKTIMNNFDKYYDKTLADCIQLENNNVRRIFNKYDPKNSGYIKKSDIQFVFMELKNYLIENNNEVNEKRLINLMLDFYAKANETCTVNEIKKCFANILSDNKTNVV